MTSSVKPLSERQVAFKAEDGVEHRCSFRELDTLLYQWKSGLLPRDVNPGEYISKALGWPKPLTDAEVVGFSHQCDRMRQEFLAECKAEVVSIVGAGYSDPPIPPQVRPADLESRFQPASVPTPVPVSNGKLSPSDLIDIACMVCFFMRVDPDLEQWGLRMMESAGCGRQEMDFAAQRMAATRRR